MGEELCTGVNDGNNLTNFVNLCRMFEWFSDESVMLDIHPCIVRRMAMKSKQLWFTDKYNCEILAHILSPDDDNNPIISIYREQESSITRGFFDFCRNLLMNLDIHAEKLDENYLLNELELLGCVEWFSFNDNDDDAILAEYFHCENEQQLLSVWTAVVDREKSRMGRKMIKKSSFLKNQKRGWKNIHWEGRNEMFNQLQVAIDFAQKCDNVEWFLDGDARRFVPTIIMSPSELAIHMINQYGDGLADDGEMFSKITQQMDHYIENENSGDREKFYKIVQWFKRNHEALVEQAQMGQQHQLMIVGRELDQMLVVELKLSGKIGNISELYPVYWEEFYHKLSTTNEMVRNEILKSFNHIVLLGIRPSPQLLENVININHWDNRHHHNCTRDEITKCRIADFLVFHVGFPPLTRRACMLMAWVGYRSQLVHLIREEYIDGVMDEQKMGRLRWKIGVVRNVYFPNGRFQNDDEMFHCSSPYNESAGSVRFQKYHTKLREMLESQYIYLPFFSNDEEKCRILTRVLSPPPTNYIGELATIYPIEWIILLLFRHGFWFDSFLFNYQSETVNLLVNNIYMMDGSGGQMEELIWPAGVLYCGDGGDGGDDLFLKNVLGQ